MSPNPSGDLDLNSDAVPLEDHNQTFKRGRSSRTVAHDSDVLVERNLIEEAAALSVNGGCDVKAIGELGASTSQKVSVSKDEEWDSGIEALKVECLAKTMELSVEQTQVVVEDEAAAMHSEAVLNLIDGISATGNFSGIPSCLEKNRSYEVEAVGVSTEENGVIDAITSMGVGSLPNLDLRMSLPETSPDSCERITSTQAEQKEAVAHLDGYEGMDSHPVEVNPNEVTCDTVDSKSIAKVTDGVAESLGSLPYEHLYSNVRVTEAHTSPPHEEQNMGTYVFELDTSAGEENQAVEVEVETEAVHGSCSENQIVGSRVSEVGVSQFSGNESNRGSIVVDLDNCPPCTDGKRNADDILKEDICPLDESYINEGACVTVDSNSVAEVTESLGPLWDGHPDSDVQVTEAHASLPHEDGNLGGHVSELCTAAGEENQIVEDEVEIEAAGAYCKHDENQIVGCHVSEARVSHLSGNESNVGSMVVDLDTCPGTDGKQNTGNDVVKEVIFPPDESYSDEGVYARVHSNTVAEVTNGVSESLGPLRDGNLESDSQVTEARDSPPHEDQIMGTHVSELGISTGEEQTMEVEVETEAAGGSCKQDENRIMGSHVSEVGVSQPSGVESNVGSLVVDRNTCPGTGGKQNTGDEIVKEDICPPHECHSKGAEVKEIGGDMGFPVSDHFDTNAADDATEVGPDGNQKVETTEHVTGSEQLKSLEKQTVTGTTFVKENLAIFRLATEKEDEFSISDLVWGKVRSHPWWPGQIFDPSDASEQAMKYHKRDSFLVAYFGDQTFAWNEASSLKPFRTHFLQMEKQANSEAFRNAVHCAMDEVFRRVELGLACSCTPEEAYAKIKSQIIENPGIREEASRRDCVDKSLSVTLFEPDKLVEYIKALALYPCGGGDRLDLAIVEAQLMAFYCLKGYFSLPEFHVYGGLLESDAEHATSVSTNEDQAPSGEGKLKRRDSCARKQKFILEDGLNPRRKERSLLELMGGDKSSSYLVNGVKYRADEKAASKSATQSSGKGRKAIASFSGDSTVKSKKQRLSTSRDADNESPTVRSFKVGDCIRRVAGQLTGSPPILKFSGERFRKSAVKVDRSNKKPDGVGVDVSPHTPEESRRRRIPILKGYSSPDEMLSQLCLAARDPMKGYGFLTNIVSFFTDFRNSISLDHVSSRKRKKSFEKIGGGKTGARNRKTSNSKTSSTGTKKSNSKTSSTETFNDEDMNDSYCTDRVIQSSPEEQPSCENRRRKGESQLDTPTKKDSPTVEPENSLQLNPTLDSKQDGLTIKPENFQMNPAMDTVEDFSPTALILGFTEADSVPSEMDLNKIFSRFGPLKESETEVLRKSSCARVVFKRRNDAEVAFSSAGKFSIFGPALVSYRLRYLSPTPSKASTHATTQGIKDATSSEGNTT